MKAIAIASLLALTACGVKGPPERPSAAAERPTNRTIIGASETTEAPGVSTTRASRQPKRRFILDGLL